MACGAICYKAFKAIADEHHFPPDFPDTEMAVGLMNYGFSSSGVYSVVAEAERANRRQQFSVGESFYWRSGSYNG